MEKHKKSRNKNDNKSLYATIKKIGFTFFILVFPLLTLASFRLDPYLEVKKGIVEEGGIMADDSDIVYIEITEKTRVYQQKNKAPYQGDILPPQVTAPALQKFPKNRIQELISFEILSGDGSPVQFIDKFDVMKEKEKRVYLQKYPQDNTRIYGAKLFIRLPQDPLPGLPILYYFDEEKNIWEKIGGSKNLSEENSQIFIAQIKNSGRYSLFDTNPAPQYTLPVNPEEIIPAEIDPYTWALQEQQKILQNNQDSPTRENINFVEENLNSRSSLENFRVIPAVETPDSTLDLEAQIWEDAASSGVHESSIDPENPDNIQVKITSEENARQNTIPQISEPELPPTLPAAGKETEISSTSLSIPWGIILAVLIILGAIYLNTSKTPATKNI
jgi:hypothetical protein